VMKRTTQGTNSGSFANVVRRLLRVPRHELDALPFGGGEELERD